MYFISSDEVDQRIRKHINRSIFKNTQHAQARRIIDMRLTK